ncbi:MAG: hypothetical protein PVH60_01365 [Anaerolineales bacterium]
MRRMQILIFMLIFTSGIFNSKPAAAQAPGYAEITAPAPGEAVQGLLIVQGSASHPLFVAYDLAFTYQESQLPTWFPIVERRETQVVDGRLGLWDTNGISDGEYKLRLRVHLENGTTLEDVIEGIRIRNQSVVETPTPAAATGFQPTATAMAPTPTSLPTPIVMPAPPGGSSVIQSLQIGLILGAVITISIGTYIYIRRRVRIRWGILRMRRMLWHEDRKKRRRD